MRTIKNVIALMCLFLGNICFAYDFEISGIYYTVSDAANRKVEVTYSVDKTGDEFCYGLIRGNQFSVPYPYGYSWEYITIPESVFYNGITWTVSGIADYAFCNYYYRPNHDLDYILQNRHLIKITLPNTIEYIGDYAFEGCVNLQSIEFPKSLHKIGTYAFAYCSSLKNVSLLGDYYDENLNYYYGVGYYCFKNCTALQYAFLEESGYGVPGLFDGCSNLTSVFIKKNSGSWRGGTKAFPSHTIVFVPSEEDVETLQSVENHYYANAVPMLKNYESGQFAPNPMVYGPFDVDEVASHVQHPENNLKNYFPESQLTKELSYVRQQNKELLSPIPNGWMVVILRYSYTIKGPYGFECAFESSYWSGIIKRELHVSVPDIRIAYGDALPKLEYNLDASQFVFDDSEETLDNPIHIDIDMDGMEVGTYDIKVSLDDSRYSVVLDNNPQLMITKAPLSVRVANTHKSYGDDNPVSYELSYIGLKNNETKPEMLTPFDISTTANKTSDVGTYDIVISGGESKNYSIEQYQNGTLSIYKADLTVKPMNAEKTYGDDNPRFILNYSGLKNGDTEATAFSVVPKITTTAKKYSNAGAYKLNVDDGVSKNYELNYEAGTLTISKAELMAKVKSYTRSYGEENPQFTISYTGFLGTDDISSIDIAPTVKCVATKDSDVGVYPIVLSGGESTNYDFIYQNGNLTIEQVEQTLYWEQTFENVSIGDQLLITAKASSGLEFTVSSDNEVVAQPYKIGRMWYIDCHAAGVAHIKIQQMGNINYLASPRVTKTVVVVDTSRAETPVSDFDYEIYDASGRKLDRFQNGINIIRYANGVVKKIVRK